ncbi:hypothetical protein [Rhizobium tubonense]|uniref:Uncharacterized protein n=1 Tax=Rhizobium tubonense TaxID=484088 RepID=A0A2W4EHP5_9HYPH|nr:hypothetical protein [Rhizobium tubonense]PZM11163.1 hypothetical protein CPY51_20490 [Rhizobium tubonense]
MTDRTGILPNDKAKSPGKTKTFGLDHRNGRLVFGSVRIPLPKSRVARVSTGIVLLFGGFLGFLPILGFWMFPLGLLVLSQDVPIVRRWRRRFGVWWARRRRKSE